MRISGANICAKVAGLERRKLAVLAAVVVVLVAVVAAVARVAGPLGETERFLGGVWVGKKEFLDRAGLQEFYLYVGPRPRGPGRLSPAVRRDAYLVVVDSAGEYVVNSPTTLSYNSLDPESLRAPVAALLGGGRAHVVEGRFAAQECGPEFAKKFARVSLHLCPVRNSLTVRGGGEVLADLTRDVVSTNSAADARAAVGAPTPK